MYSEFYNLRGSPFRLNPDHRFFFVAEPHEKAIAHLRYALNRNEGFVVVTGEVGAGKTTLVNRMLSDLEESRYITGNIVTSFIEHEELVSLVAATFGIEIEGKNKASLLLGIRSFLEEERVMGRRPILFVDEVQNLPESSLEELRMLSNFCLPGESLLQIFLVGQPEFRETLADERLEQLRQRVVTSCHLGTLGLEDTRSYILHRLNLANWSGDPAFSDRCFELIHHLSNGVPRRINVICDRLLLHGFLEELHRIDSAVVAVVARDMMDEGLLKLADVTQPPDAPPGPGTQETSRVVRLGKNPAREDRAVIEETSADDHERVHESLTGDVQDDDTLLLETSQKVTILPEQVVREKELETHDGLAPDSEPRSGRTEVSAAVPARDASNSGDVQTKGPAEEAEPERSVQAASQLPEDMGANPVQADTFPLNRRIFAIARPTMAAAVLLALVLLPEASLLRQAPSTSVESLQLSSEVETGQDTSAGSAKPELIPAALTASGDKQIQEDAFLLPASTASESELISGEPLKLEEIASDAREIVVVALKVENEAGQGSSTEPTTAEPESLLKPDTVKLSEQLASTAEERFLVQLVALRSADEAGRLHAQFEQRFEDLLSSYDLGVQEAKIAGTQYFRVMTGVAGDRGEMLEICARIKEGGQDCILVLDTGA